MDKKIADKKEDKAEENKKDQEENIKDKVEVMKKEDEMNTKTEESQLMPTQVARVQDTTDKDQETAEEVHTQVASITLQPNPSKLGSSVKINRSKSVNSEHPSVDKNCKEKERKFSFNQPMPSSCPPALKL